MKKIVLTIIAMGMVAFLANCVSSGYDVPPGSLYTNYTVNKDVSTAADVSGKEGTACASNILGWVATGDAGIKAAASSGGIKTVKAVDFSRMVILGSIYTKVCTIARGD